MKIKLLNISFAAAHYVIADDCYNLEMDLTTDEAEDLIKVLEAKLEETTEKDEA